MRLNCVVWSRLCVFLGGLVSESERKMDRLTGILARSAIVIAIMGGLLLPLLG
jgi:hypothetical protein